MGKVKLNEVRLSDANGTLGLGGQSKFQDKGEQTKMIKAVARVRYPFSMFLPLECGQAVVVSNIDSRSQITVYSSL